MLKRYLKLYPRLNLKCLLDNINISKTNFNSNYIFELPNICETQWYTESQIIEFQERLLRRLIHYAYNEIPYYKKLFKKIKIKPDQIKHIVDLERIPILTREAAIENYEKLINPNLICNTHRSSATTGRRLTWAYSKNWMDLFERTLWRGFGWAGLTPDKRVVSMYSRVIGEVARDSLLIRDAFDPNRIKNDLELIRTFKPQFAYCYSSSAYIIARYLINADEKLPLEGVIVTSDQLFPQDRQVIEDAFQCKLYNNYGCNDGGAWGAECDEHSGFHQDFERSIIEFDKDGSMLATDLWNYAMPFIRYQNGDVGKWLYKTCKCGRKMPLFEVTGRIDDYIVTLSNKIISPTVCQAFIKNECFIDFRVIQHSESEIEILYVRNPKFNTDECKIILRPLILLLKDMVVVINETDNIQRSPSLKQRIVENRSSRTINQIMERVE